MKGIFAKYNLIALLVCSIFLFLSCGDRKGKFDTHVKFIEKTLSDTAGRDYKIISSLDNRDNCRVIAVIGATDETALMAETLMSSDMFDNIDGKLVPDGLPDFAGETVSAVFDVANEPYYGYFKAGNDAYMDEIVARSAVFAVSDSCCSSPFDRTTARGKKGAKVIMLVSPYFSGRGYDDVVEMFKYVGKNVAVVAPVQSSIGYVLENKEDVQAIGVWADIDVIASGTYTSVFRKMVSGSAFEDAGCVCLSPRPGDGKIDAVTGFLDMYRDAGHSIPLSAVIVDNMLLADRVDGLNEAVAELKTSGDTSLVRYSRLLAEDFSFVSPKTTMAMDCYRFLRRENLFTHRIAYPAAEGYLALPSGEIPGSHIEVNGLFTEDYKYTRAPGSDVETVRIIPASHRYLQEERLQRIDSLAPLISKQLFYVYK